MDSSKSFFLDIIMQANPLVIIEKMTVFEKFEIFPENGGNLLVDMISTLKNSNRTVFDVFMAQKLNRGQKEKVQTSTSHKTVTERSCAACVILFSSQITRTFRFRAQNLILKSW